ncbi:hypothetical protein ACHAXT_001681 [Thalassiosira profunda]
MSANNAAPDLNQVVAAVGQQLFSYLPTGALLCGAASPMLVNRTFHEGAFQCLGQAETLDLSCRHLRKVTDEQLIGLIRKIVDVGEASKARDGDLRAREYARQHIHRRDPFVPPHPLKVVCLDLSRCRFLRGEGVFFCLKHMPGIKRILLSSATRFEAHHQFSDELNSDALEVKKLEYVDFAGCSRMNARGAMSFAATIERCNLRHLNLSGVSAQLDDEALGVLAYFCNIESLNLAGARKITEFGAGLALYVCRGTLKSLNLRECDRVCLPNLLMDTAQGIRTLIDEDNMNGDHLAIYPPNYVGSPGSLPTFWLNALNNSTRNMMIAQPSLTTAQIAKSRLLLEGFKRAENDFSARMEWGERKEGSMFGCLEHLDVSLIGQKTGSRIDGCLAVIAWLNGGRLKHVDFDGLDFVLTSDLAVLSATSPGLLSLSVLSSTTRGIPAGRYISHYLRHFFENFRNVRELNLSCCHWSSVNINMVCSLKHLRSLKVEFTNVDGGALQLLLARSTKLIRLSIKGCSRLKSSNLANTANTPELELLDLDLRELEMDVPLAEVKRICPRLLRINNRCTPFGAQMLKAHRSAFLWRTGTSDNARSKSKKRTRAGDSVDSENAPSNDTIVESSFTNSCSLMRTAFSSAKETEQEMYACRTCFVGSNRFVCLACAKRCHAGHDVFSVGSSCGYCDCCIFTECQCLKIGDVEEASAGIAAELIGS